MKKILAIAVIFVLASPLLFMFFEPQLTEAATTTNQAVTVNQSVTGEITLSCGTPVNMSPAIAGMTGGTGSGTSTCTVTTNDTSGFNLKLKAGTSPALKASSYSFADYTPATSSLPDFTWAIASSASEFGYTINADVNDIDTSFKDDGSACNTGTNVTDNTCWLNASTTDEQVGYRTSQTTSSGSSVSIKFQAQSGTTHFQEEGTYSATITVTASINS